MTSERSERVALEARSEIHVVTLVAGRVTAAKSRRQKYCIIMPVLFLLC